jgi:hypothetical protein
MNPDTVGHLLLLAIDDDSLSRGATKRLSWPDSVLANIKAMLQSVADEKNLKPETR